jgi:hypothetical protein
MMTRGLLWIGLMLTLPGCLDTRGDTDLNRNRKTCELLPYTSNIVIHYSQLSGTPKIFSGDVSGKVRIDECTTGNNSPLYTVTRQNGTAALITIWLPRGSEIYNSYFSEDGLPKPGPKLKLKLYGRDQCKSPAHFITEISREIEWQPIYKDSGAECEKSGYSAAIR